MVFVHALCYRVVIHNLSLWVFISPPQCGLTLETSMLFSFPQDSGTFFDADNFHLILALLASCDA